MAPVTNARVIFNEIPKGYPEPGRTTVFDTSEKIDLDNVKLKPQSIVVKIIALSVDPYLRGKMRDPNTPSYASAFELGKPLYGEGIAHIMKSTHSELKEGCYIFGQFSFANYAILENPQIGGATGIVVLKNEEGLPWTAYLGACGMPGRTAYYGWKEYSSAKKGRTAFVTTAGGPVGSFVVQLAKRDGLKVIASAGSQDKIDFVKSIGADVAFNYKSTSTDQVLKKEGPVDVYWDNVGGESLDAALGNANLNAHFIECGMISKYNSEDPLVLHNGMNIMAKRLRIFGLLIWDLEEKYGKEFMDVVPKLVARGETKYQEDVTDGLGKAGDVILAVQKGENKAKAIIRVARD